MKHIEIKKYIVISMMALLVSITGCNKNEELTDNADFKSNDVVNTDILNDSSNGEDNEIKVLGEGKYQFDFKMIDKDKNEVKFEIHTDEETVGAALLELKVIEGDEGPYGLYVKKVNGITLDYDKDDLYWAFYVNDKYASKGVDTTKIKEGEIYSFRAEES